MRASGQFGFRRERSTADASLVLSSVIDAYRAQSRSVYVAFVDFRKAYDCINRDILWSCLKHMGVTESALSLIRSMYDCVAFRIRIQGALGPIFYSSIGVKQGHPLSPLLFGLLIDRLEEFLEKECPHIGVHLRNQMIKLLYMQMTWL